MAKDQRLFIKRNYYSGEDAPYCNMVHVAHPAMFGGAVRQGKEIALDAMLGHLLERLPDGAVFQVEVHDTGERMGGRMESTAPGVYSLVEGEA